MATLIIFPMSSNIRFQNGSKFSSLKDFLTGKYQAACLEVNFNSNGNNVAERIHTANILKKLIPQMRNDRQSDLDVIGKLKNLLPKLGDEAELWYNSQNF